MRITIRTHHVAFDPRNLPTYSQMEEALANAVMNVISQHRNRHVGRASIQTFLAPPDLAHFHACRHYAVIIQGFDQDLRVRPGDVEWRILQGDAETADGEHRYSRGK